VSTAPSSSGPITSPTPKTPAEQAAAAVKAMSDVDLVGQLLVPSLDISAKPAVSAALVSRYHLGGVIIMGDVQGAGQSGSAAAQVQALTAALQAASQAIGTPVSQQTDLLIGTDQEYGWVTRIKSGLVQLPSAMAFGAAAQPALTEAAWKAAGTELAAVGVNVDFAPDADVIGTPGNLVIGSRSFGSDPTAVSAQVAAAVRGLQSAGVAATLKHFPGHGHTTVDSHTELPVLGQSLTTLTTGDLPPFQAGIAADTWLVMSGHLDVTAVDPGLPASFSDKVLVDLLRGQLGFGGVVITDSLSMAPAEVWPPGEAAVRAVLAGNDMLLMSPDLAAAQQSLLAALASGRLPRARILQAVTRILTLRYRLKTFTRPAATVLNAPADLSAAQAVASAAVTVLQGACTGALVTGPVRITTATGREQQAAWLSDALAQQGVSVSATGATDVHLVGYGDTAADLSDAATVTVAMDTPFILGSAHSAVRMATYSSTQAAMQALAVVLAGKARATGRSPVAVAGLPASAC
jgi:beta-N-acetylhexosaminidase